MQIYSVGPDELSECDFGYLNKDAFEWFVYYYVNGGYDGYGHGVALRKEDGKLAYNGLGHCSCYGPIESDWLDSKTCTVEEYLARKSTDSIYDDEVRDELKDKVKELLG